MTARPDLPAGNVTCVFTDIEGSTRLLRELGPRYHRLLAQHDEVLRAAWRDHGGHEIKTLGDAFMVMFERASDAVAAAVTAARALAQIDWQTELPVRVRIGMHTGYALPKDGDYTALMVHQAARVVSAARGGQVLLTATTAAEVEDGARLDAVTLRLLGRFRVRDFEEPVALYDATGPGTPVIDAPPRVRPADGHNLVRPPTTLVGRGADLNWLAGTVAAGQVTTVVGPGGVGKTRLATEAALLIADDWPDGAWFVDLGPLSDGVHVAEAIGDAVGAPTSPGAWRGVLAHLAERRALVVLDNCEHLPEASATAASELVSACPGVAVVATSRRSLGLRGERVHRLAPLVGDGAVALFLDRNASDAAPDRTTVADLCRELDGLPLAIELAAARSAAVPPDEILRRLRRGPSVIQSEDPTLPNRQRSLDRLLDWSWELLTPAARTVLGRLSVFAGSFDMAAAEQVGAGPGEDPDAVADVVWTLVDASLVRPEEAAGATRYRLLATVRAHAANHADDEDRAAATRRLAAVLLERIGPARVARTAWIAEMALELDNVRGAVAQTDEDAAAQALAWSIGRYHDAIDVYGDTIAELTRILDARPEPGPDRVGLLAVLADLHIRLGDLRRADATIGAASELERAVGAPRWDEAAVARTRGELALRRGDAETAMGEALRGLDTVGSPWARARLQSLLGCARRDLGDLDGAIAAFQDELQAAMAAGAHTFLVATHANLAELLVQRGDEAAASFHQAVALGLARELRKPVIVAFSLMIAARLLVARGRAYEAIVLQTRADALLADADYVLYDDDERVRAALLDEAAGRLSDEELETATTAGDAMTADAAADLAEEVFAEVSSPSDTSTRGPVG